MYPAAQQNIISNQGYNVPHCDMSLTHVPRYSNPADIPAPLSQVDEPTEELFKEEKEALKKQKGKKENTGNRLFLNLSMLICMPS